MSDKNRDNRRIIRCLSCSGYAWIEDDDGQVVDCDWCGGVGYVYRDGNNVDHRIPETDYLHVADILERLEMERMREIGYTGEAKKPWEQAIRQRPPVYVLIHSPLVGVSTWEQVANELRQQDYSVVLPVLTDTPDSPLSYWKQHAKSVRQSLVQFPQNQPFIFVAHSGAGPLLPAIRQLLLNPVIGYLFVDAGIPRDAASRLDLLKTESPEWAEEFHQALLEGETYPAWSADDLREIVPDEATRQKIVAEIHPRSLNFFEEPIPVFAGWPDAPCAYVKLSDAYSVPAEQAKQLGWPVREIEGGHFHMVVDPAVVANALIETVDRLQAKKL